MLRSIRPFRPTRATAFARVLLLSAATLLGAGAVALAAGDDRSAAEAALKDVAASARKDAADPLTARARAALDRGAKLRSSGDEAHAKLADGVARSWAETARDVARAAAIEDAARVTRLAAVDAGVVADRERALLEESVAQSGRLRAQLEAIAHEAKEEPARTSTSATLDAGARPRPKAKPPAARPAADGGAR
jgi:hypothetical protein